MPALVVLNEDAVPKTYWEPGEPRLRRQVLAHDLKGGCRGAWSQPLQSRAGLEREDTVMGFSAKQLQALKRQPSRSHIRTREAHGRALTYLEGWYAISEANRIFGFDGWSRETIESKCVLSRETKGTFLAVYIARVRSPCRRTGQPLSARAMAPGKAEALPRRGA